MTRTNRNLKKNNTKRRSIRNKSRIVNKKFIKGGMLLKGNYSPKGALLYFLMNSKFEYSGTGASSITLKCNFNKDPNKSPYYGLSAFATLGQPITCILLKLSFWANHDTKRQENKKKHKMINLFAMVILHTQLWIGLVQYFGTSSKVQFIEGWMKNPLLRFYGMEHLAGMLIAIIVVTIGHSKSKKGSTPEEKYKLILDFLIANFHCLLHNVDFIIFIYDRL